MYFADASFLTAGRDGRPTASYAFAPASGERYATDERIDLTADLLAEAQKETTVEAVLDRLLSDVVRENYTKLYSSDELVVSEKEFRSAVAERVRRRLG